MQDVERGLTRRQFAIASATITGIWVSRSASGAPSGFPERAITLVDPASPGSSTDIFSRALADEMSKLWGQPVVVENKPGAGGALAAEFVAKAKPDGYTLGLAAVSTHVSNPAVNRALRYDPLLDFAPITRMITLPSVTVVRADSALRNLKDLIVAAKDNPSAISFASPGIGSAGHVLMEQFAHLAGVKFLHIPYKGSSGMLNDLLGGQLTVVSDNIPAVLPLIKAGKLRAIATRDTQRLTALPDVLTYGEQGFESVSYPLWFGLVAPAGTPDPVIKLLNGGAHSAMRTPGFQARVQTSAVNYAPSTPEVFKLEIEEWLVRFKKVVETVNIKID
jgi:tripartite-type tricarboxylate transporter receptor subunit TctC